MKKHLVGGALLLALISLCMGCGSVGTVYGAITWPNGYKIYVDENFDATSGFPSQVMKDSYYPVSSGSHFFKYYLKDSYYYYDTFLVSYTVTPNLGLSYGQKGADTYFTINCSPRYGAAVTGLNIVDGKGKIAASLDPKADGKPVTVTCGMYDVSVTVTKVDIPASERETFIKHGD
jgi:hypothetical protein